MGRGPHYKGDIRGKVDELAADQKLPVNQIYAQLQETFGERVAGLALRTVERWVRRQRGAPSEPWNSAGADPEEVAAVLGVLSVIMKESGGASFTVTRDQAKWISKIRRTVPAMPAAVVYRFTLDYVAAAPDVSHLDTSLATARSVEGPLPGGGFRLERSLIAAHVRLHVTQWPRKPLVFWSGSQEAAQLYVLEMGEHASLLKKGDYHGYLVSNPDYSWYNESGFGRLLIDLREGAL